MLSVIKEEEEISLFGERSEWEHLSEFEDMISDSSDNDYCHRNFRKTVYIYILLSYFSVWKGKMNWGRVIYNKNGNLKRFILFSA